MPARRGDGDRPLGHLLPADVGEVFYVVRQVLEQLVQARGRRLNLKLACKERYRLCEIVDRDDIQPFNNR